MKNRTPSIVDCIKWLDLLEDVSLDKGSVNLDNDLDVIVKTRDYLKELARILKGTAWGQR